MANPDHIEIDPVKSLLCHPVRHIGTAIEEDRSAICLQPKSGRSASRMKDCGAGTEHDELHSNQSEPG